MSKKHKDKKLKTRGHPNTHPGKQKGGKPAGKQSQGAQAPAKKNPTQQQHLIPTIPYDTEDRILLVGEGDFSFSKSLIEHHGMLNVTATSYDSETDLKNKYPQAEENVAFLRENDAVVICSVDATKLNKTKSLKKKKFDVVVFQFPHVGGLTKDMDRQIRSNQELLLGFFTAAKELLIPTGTTVVTLFEGSPYNLWDIRRLAKSMGLKSQRSFKFQSEAYPGYRHVRTLGNIEGDGGWKGEQRDSRSFVFEIQGGGKARGGGKGGEGGGEKVTNFAKKRKWDDSDSEEDDD
ncbi:hypothetical protein RUND412_002774 [Rhizina undulata]